MSIAVLTVDTRAEYYLCMHGAPQQTAHPIRRAVFEQGRRLTWLARELGISSNHLHRILLPAGHPDSRTAPAGFYGRVSLLLGVSEESLIPTEPVAA